MSFEAGFGGVERGDEVLGVESDDDDSGVDAVAFAEGEGEDQEEAA